MADGNIAGVRALQGQVSDGEWQARVDLAALYRLVALEGWDDLIFTHISARVPESEHFLINPYGVLFEEMTASSLVKIDLQGKVLSDTPYPVNHAGFVIHSAVHMANDEGHWIIHLHTRDGVAVSAQNWGLLPITQNATLVEGLLAYHDYEGVAMNLDERERVVRDLGDKPLMMLRNHGTLSVAASAAQAWMQIYFLEIACTQQIAALAAGRDNLTLAPPPSRAMNHALMQKASMAQLGALAWPGLMRRLQRRSPGFEA